jgi:hypothetical protein
MKGHAVSASNSDGLNSNPPFQTVQTVQTVISDNGRGVWTGDSSCSMVLNPNLHGAFQTYGEREVCSWPLTPPGPVSDYSDHSDGFFSQSPG